MHVSARGQHPRLLNGEHYPRPQAAWMVSAQRREVRVQRASDMNRHDPSAAVRRDHPGGVIDLHRATCRGDATLRKYRNGLTLLYRSDQTLQGERARVIEDNEPDRAAEESHDGMG